MITLSQKMKKRAQQNNNEEKAPKRASIRDRLLQMEVEDLKQILPSSAVADFPNSNMLHRFHVTIRPTDGYWRGGKFEFEVDVPEEYNISPPKVRCLTPLWHPNITEKGEVCLSLLRHSSIDPTGWTPSRSLKDVILGLDALFGDLLNFDDPLNFEAAQQYLENKEGFAATVREYIKRNTRNT